MPETKSNTASGRSKTYLEKLQDPRWQRVRLAVMGREDFTCQGCGAKNKPLQVHHGYYERGFEPWDYPTDTLWCLCSGCHEEAERQRIALYRRIGRQNPLRVHWEAPGSRTVSSEKVTVREILSIVSGDVVRVEPSAEPTRTEFPVDVCYCCGKHDPEKRIPIKRSKKRKTPRYRSICSVCYEELTKDAPCEKTLLAKIGSWHGVYIDRLRKQQKKLAGIKQ